MCCEEMVQEVLLNIVVIGGEQIEEQGFFEFVDVFGYVLGINIVDCGGCQGNLIIVCGFNVDLIGLGDGNNDGGGMVVIYFGEILFFIDLKLNDMECVEVLFGL